MIMGKRQSKNVDPVKFAAMVKTQSETFKDDPVNYDVMGKTQLKTSKDDPVNSDVMGKTQLKMSKDDPVNSDVMGKTQLKTSKDDPVNSNVMGITQQETSNDDEVTRPIRLSCTNCCKLGQRKYFCVDCIAYVCVSCIDEHKQGQSQSHIVIDKLGRAYRGGVFDSGAALSAFDDDPISEVYDGEHGEYNGISVPVHSDLSSGQPESDLSSRQTESDLSSGQPESDLSSEKLKSDLSSGKLESDLASGQPESELSSGQLAYDCVVGRRLGDADKEGVTDTLDDRASLRNEFKEDNDMLICASALSSEQTEYSDAAGSGRTCEYAMCFSDELSPIKQIESDCVGGRRSVQNYSEYAEVGMESGTYF